MTHIEPLRVVLLSGDGRFVGSARIPPFNEPPTVLLWGNRVFVRRSSGDTVLVDQTGYDAAYQEAFTYVIVGKVTA